MRNLKELMKDEGGTGMISTCVCGGAGLLCHGLNCFGSVEQSVCISVATLITNVWTTWQTDRARWCMTIADSISNVVGK